MKFFRSIFFILAAFSFLLPVHAQVTVSDKSTGDTLSAAEITQIIQALKSELAADIIISTTFQLPDSETAQTVTGATGQLAWDQTDGVAIVQTGSATKVLAHPTLQHTTVICGATLTNRIVPIMMAPKDMAMTITRISAGTVLGGSVSIMFDERAFGSFKSIGSNIHASTTEINPYSGDITSFSNASIAARAGVFGRVESVTGYDHTSDALMVTVYYEKALE